MNEGRILASNKTASVYPAGSITLWLCTLRAGWVMHSPAILPGVHVVIWSSLVAVKQPAAVAWKICFENPSRVWNMQASPPPFAQLWCENRFGGEAATWQLQVLRPDFFSFCLLETIAWAAKVGASGLFSVLGSSSWRGRSRAGGGLGGDSRPAPLRAPALSLCSRHLVLGFGCTSQGPGLVKFASLPPFWN